MLMEIFVKIVNGFKSLDTKTRFTIEENPIYLTEA